MRLVLRYVEKTKAGGWQYRRRVPKDLSAVILKREFKGKLGDTEREALAAYPGFHAKVEREIANARRSAETATAAESGQLSDLQLFKLAYQRALEMGMLSTDWDGRDQLAQAIISRYLKTTRKGNLVFPSYCRPRGSDAASAALMSHLRAVTNNPKHVVHSLRHNMKDRLMVAEVSSMDQNLILGHELGGVGDRVYGGTPAKLRVTTRAMLKAFGLTDPKKAGTDAEATENAAEAL